MQGSLRNEPAERRAGLRRPSNASWQPPVLAPTCGVRDFRPRPISMLIPLRIFPPLESGLDLRRPRPACRRRRGKCVALQSARASGMAWQRRPPSTASVLHGSRIDVRCRMRREEVRSWRTCGQAWSMVAGDGYLVGMKRCPPRGLPSSQCQRPPSPTPRDRNERGQHRTKRASRSSALASSSSTSARAVDFDGAAVPSALTPPGVAAAATASAPGAATAPSVALALIGEAGSPPRREPSQGAFLRRLPSHLQCLPRYPPTCCVRPHARRDARRTTAPSTAPSDHRSAV